MRSPIRAADKTLSLDVEGTSLTRMRVAEGMAIAKGGRPHWGQRNTSRRHTWSICTGRPSTRGVRSWRG